MLARKAEIDSESACAGAGPNIEGLSEAMIARALRISSMPTTRFRSPSRREGRHTELESISRKIAVVIQVEVTTSVRGVMKAVTLLSSGQDPLHHFGVFKTPIPSWEKSTITRPG